MNLIPSDMIRYIVSFLGGEGVFIYLNKEWKREYLSQHGIQTLSPGIVRTARRFFWARSNGGYIMSERDIPCILKNRIRFEGLEQLMIDIHKHEKAAEYCIDTDDLELLNFLLDKAGYYKCVYREFVSRACQQHKIQCLIALLDGYNEILEYHSILEDVIILKRFALVDVFFEKCPMTPKQKRTFLRKAFRYGDISMIHYLYQLGAECSADMVIDAVANDSAPGIGFLREKDLVSYREARLILILAVKEKSIKVLDYLLETFPFTQKEIEEATNIAEGNILNHLLAYTHHL